MEPKYLGNISSSHYQLKFPRQSYHVFFFMACYSEIIYLGQNEW